VSGRVAAVSEGMKQGKSLAELQQTLLFEKYKDWNCYAVRRAPTIDSAYRNLQMFK
jgi:hypothetical protein